MASEKFKPQEYVDLSETLIKNGDILTGKLGSLKRDGEQLKKTYDSMFNVSEDDLNDMLANNSDLKDLYDELIEKIKVHTDLIDKFSNKVTEIADLYGITDEKAKDSIALAKEYYDIKDKIDELERNISEEENKQLQLQNEITNLLNNGSGGTSVYADTVAELDKVNESLDRNYALLLDNEIEINKINKNLAKNPIAENFVNEIEKGNGKLSSTILLMNKIEATSEDINDIQSKGVGLTQQQNQLLEKQNKAYGAIASSLKGIWGLVKEGGNKWIEIDDRVSKVGRSIGLSTEQIRGYQKNILANYSDMAARLGMTTEEMMKFQESYTKNTGRAIMLTNEQVETLGAMSRLVGDVATNDMVKNMDDFGASTQTATSYLALNMARARSQGLDAQKASEAFSKNVKLASQYTFREGINGISKMTLLSQKLKFNMDSIANAAGRFETVQSAIETAANLQMLGGSYAAQFGNPLEAMNMAMLDMEGFTNKIVDTFKGKATFNRETGQVDMSAIDKRLLKEAASQLGISYEEAWNMASQSAKIGDVERQLNKSQTFSEDDKAWITSKSQYDAETKQHYVTIYDENGEEEKIDVSQLTEAQLKIAKQQEIPEKAIQGDVHGIHSILKAYVEKEAGDSRSLKEIMIGAKESRAVAMADWVDPGMDTFKNVMGSLTTTVKNFGEIAVVLSGVFAIGKSIFSTYFSDTFNKGAKNVASRMFGGGSGSTQTPNNPSGNGGGANPTTGGTGTTRNSRTARPKSKIAKGGVGRTLNRLGLKTLGKTGLKTLSKRIPYIGTAIAAIGGVVDASNAISSYSQKKLEIESSNMSEKEKAIAKTEAKRERNKGVGGAVGSTGGALGGAALGAAIGSFILPGVGTIIGGALGGWLGEKAGKEVGSAVGAAVTTEEKVENEKKEKELKDKEVKVNDNGVILAQIKDYNQLIYELLLNKYSSVTKETVTNLSSVDQSVIKEQRQHLAISSNKNDINKEYAYGGTSNNFIESGVIAQGNALRNHNGKDYDLTDPKQRYEYQINQLLDRNITSGKQRESRNKQLELITREAQELYGIEPYDYKADERYLAIQNSINNSHYANKANYVNNDNLHSSDKHNNAISRTNYVNNDNLYANNEHNNYNNAISRTNYVNNDNLYANNGHNNYNKYNNGQTINGTDSFALTNNEKISQFINDFTQKATFNAETNTYEMSAIDKRIMKEAAKQLGVDNDGMWEMISQNINNNFENQTNAKYASYSNDSYNIDDSNNIMKPYNYSLLNNIAPKDINYNNDITPKVTVGLQTPIRETSIRNQFSNSISDNNGKIDLNVSGSIKLTTDRGSSTEIDINKLLNNTEFMNNLVSIISENFNKRVNGQRHLKNAVSYLQNGGYGYNQFNSITNGWG